MCKYTKIPKDKVKFLSGKGYNELAKLFLDDG